MADAMPAHDGPVQDPRVFATSNVPPFGTSFVGTGVPNTLRSCQCVGGPNCCCMRHIKQEAIKPTVNCNPDRVTLSERERVILIDALNSFVYGNERVSSVWVEETREIMKKLDRNSE